MIHHITIDDSTKAGAGLLQVIQTLSSTDIGVKVIDDNEERADEELISIVKKNLNAGFLNKKEKAAWLKKNGIGL